LLLRPPLSDYFDSKIFIHIDFDEMLKRAEKRDVPKYGIVFLQKYINKYIPVQKQYLQEHRPQINCDILIDNTDYLCPKIIKH
jgi:uridine kinase